MLFAALSTAPQRALLKTTVRTGKWCLVEAWWHAAGLANRYEPSPTHATTVRSGAACFAPSAAGSPQPRPPAGGTKKYERWRVRPSGAGGSQYSLNTAASGVRTSARAAATKSREIGP